MNININEVNEYDDINVKRNGKDIEIKVSGQHINFNIYDEKTVYKKNVTKVNEEKESYSKAEYNLIARACDCLEEKLAANNAEYKKSTSRLEEEYCLKLNEQNRDIENLKEQLKKEMYDRNERELFNKAKITNVEKTEYDKPVWTRT